MLEGHHSERELMKGLVQHPQGQDWSESPTFLGYDEVGSVKPFLPLGQGGMLYHALHQNGRDFCSKNSGILKFHCGKQNATELRQTSAKLNRIAKSNGSEKAPGRAGELQLKVDKTEHNRHYSMFFFDDCEIN